MRRQAWLGRAAVVLVVIVTSSTACTSDDGDEPVEVEAGQVEQVDATAIEDTATAAVGLPSGVLTLEVAQDLGPVPSGKGSLEPVDEGVTLLGLEWSFEAHPSSDARSVLLDGRQPQDLPQPTLTVVDGGAEVPVPITAQAGRSGAMVVGVSDPLGIEVTYDGFTQTVDPGTGAVGAGPAESLLELATATTSVDRLCDARDFPVAATLDNGCQVAAIHRLPYVAGLGWAPDSRSWLVVDARIEGKATMLLGDDPGTVLDSAAPSVVRAAFVVSGDATRTVSFDFGRSIGVVSVPLEP